MQRLYQFKHQSVLLCHNFSYMIKKNDESIYQVGRKGLRKLYRQFEDMDGKVLYYIGEAKIKSIEDEEILANIHISKNIIETKIGNFTLTDLDIRERTYILKENDKIIAQITKQDDSTHDWYSIDMKDINEKHQAFIFALIILIDVTLKRVQSPVSYAYSMHGHCSVIKE